MVKIKRMIPLSALLWGFVVGEVCVVYVVFVYFVFFLSLFLWLEFRVTAANTQSKEGKKHGTQNPCVYVLPDRDIRGDVCHVL